MLDRSSRSTFVVPLSHLSIPPSASFRHVGHKCGLGLGNKRVTKVQLTLYSQRNGMPLHSLSHVLYLSKRIQALLKRIITAFFTLRVNQENLPICPQLL